MRKATKQLSISRKVKEAVYRRDGGYCVLCGSPYGLPNAHYIARSQGGLGIEENVVTLCEQCHWEYDQSYKRKALREKLRAYLQNNYPDWDERKLIYRKGM